MIGNPTIEDIDHTADGVGAPQNRRRSAHDLDLFGGEWIDAHRVIGADRGHIAGVESVLEDSDAICAQPPNDGPARTLTVRGCVDPRLLGQGLAQSRLLAQHQVLAGEDIDRLSDLAQTAGDTRCGHGDGLGVNQLVEADGDGFAGFG